MKNQKRRNQRNLSGDRAHQMRSPQIKSQRKRKAHENHSIDLGGRLSFGFIIPFFSYRLLQSSVKPKTKTTPNMSRERNVPQSTSPWGSFGASSSAPSPRQGWPPQSPASSNVSDFEAPPSVAESCATQLESDDDV